MGAGILIRGTGGAGRKTLAAGTPITQLIPPKRGLRSRLDNLAYTAGTTAHTLTALQAIGKTTLSAAAAAGQAVVPLTADPSPAGNPIAALDWVVIEKPDGTFHVGQANGALAGLNLTLSANVPTGGFAAGATVWLYGAPGDTVPATGDTHPQYALAASATTTLTNASGNGVIGGNRNYEPLLLHSDNATVAGTLLTTSFIFTEESGSGIPTFAGFAGDDGDDQGAGLMEGGILDSLPWDVILGGLLDALLKRLGRRGGQGVRRSG